jgi:hypothetical protein
MAGTGYAALNLKWNPFGTLTRAEKQALVVPRLDLSPFVERLRQPGYAVQILATGVSGKTTHLLFLHDYFPDAPYVCLDEPTRHPLVPDAPILFLDQLQLMPLRQRLVLFRRPASFAIVSHRNHRWEFRLARLAYDLVTLPPYSAAQLKEVLDRRLTWAWRDPGQPLPQVSLEVVRELLRRCGGEVVVLQHLYDRVERLAAQPEGHLTGGNWLC